MYQRFLNNNDYLGILTEEALQQLIRGNEERLAQAEEAAEESIIEYLIDHYEIEKELAVGKRIVEHSKQMIYPVGSHFYHEGKIYEAIRTINGYKVPSLSAYWEEYTGEPLDETKVPMYTQLETYQPNDIVRFANVIYRCIEPNGLGFNDIRIPNLIAWVNVEPYEWKSNLQYDLWELVKFNGKFYALTSTDNIDLTIDPHESRNWGLVGEYTPDFKYQLSNTEYVAYKGKAYVPIINVNADKLQEGYNMRLHDPRNPNIKKHLLRLAIYELHKLISPNNISTARITDYETSIMWLRDAAKLKINPKIERRLDDSEKPVTEYAIATFMRDYDPYKNIWQI